MASPIVQFIVIALFAGLGLWVLSNFPTLDATVVKFVRIAVYVVLSILFINLVLFMLFGKGLSGYLVT